MKKEDLTVIIVQLQTENDRLKRMLARARKNGLLMLKTMKDQCDIINSGLKLSKEYIGYLEWENKVEARLPVPKPIEINVDENLCLLFNNGQIIDKWACDYDPVSKRLKSNGGQEMIVHSKSEIYPEGIYHFICDWDDKPVLFTGLWRKNETRNQNRRPRPLSDRRGDWRIQSGRDETPN